MAYIIQKKRNNNIYYYLAESARINGKPRVKIIKYLGTSDTIVRNTTVAVDIPKPEFSRVFEFGAIIALYDIAERIGIRAIIEKHVSKRNQGLAVADTILLAAINRAIMPKSKNGFYEWYENTVLPRLFTNANKTNLSSQGFWNNMAQLDQTTIREIEDEIVKIVVKKYEINTECLLFDNTNFYTYIDTDTQSTYAQRGHSKEKRSDLKIIGLSLMVSPDNNIPLFHEVYPGNTNDAKRFSEIIPKLKRRCKTLGLGECGITLVFDRGNNSDNNIEDVLGEEPLQFHFVGGVKQNQCRELLQIPLKDMGYLQSGKLKKTRAYRTSKHIFGNVFTVVMTFNPELYKSQIRGVKNNIKKCAARLRELSERLDKWRTGEITKGRRPSKSGVNKQVSSILSAEHMKKVFYCTVAEENGFISLKHEFDYEQFSCLKRNSLGRSVLFTDHDDWTNEQIVGAYRSQYHVEEAFKRMKDTDHLTFRPIFHFTDSKIVVHAFYCVLAFLLSSLLNRELADIGCDISINTMLDSFQKVKEVITYFPKNCRCKNSKVISYSGMDGIAQIFFEKYKLMPEL